MEQFKDLLVASVRKHIMEEGLPRIQKCLSELTEEEVWFRPNEHSNSVGNLILHLCGNIRQWVLTGIGGAPDHRQRQTEFDERGPIPKEILTQKLVEVLQEVDVLLEHLTTEQLLQPVTVQGFSETGLSILMHVTEHFSYHTGQITWFVKGKNDLDTNYYGGYNLNVVGE